MCVNVKVFFQPWHDSKKTQILRSVSVLAFLCSSHKQTIERWTKSTSSINQNAGQGPCLNTPPGTVAPDFWKAVSEWQDTLEVQHSLPKATPWLLLDSVLPELSPRHQPELKVLTADTLKTGMNHVIRFWLGGKWWW